MVERWLSGAPVALAEDPRLTPIPKWWLETVCKSRSRNYEALFWTSQASGMHKIHIHTSRQGTHTQSYNILKVFNVAEKLFSTYYYLVSVCLRNHILKEKTSSLNRTMHIYITYTHTYRERETERERTEINPYLLT